MNIRPKTLKKMIGDELKEHYDAAFQMLCEKYAGDVQKELLRIGYESLKKNLESCTSYEELDDFVSLVGYRMSLQEWIDSY